MSYCVLHTAAYMYSNSSSLARSTHVRLLDLHVASTGTGRSTRYTRTGRSRHVATTAVQAVVAS